MLNGWHALGLPRRLLPAAVLFLLALTIFSLTRRTTQLPAPPALGRDGRRPGETVPTPSPRPEPELPLPPGRLPLGATGASFVYPDENGVLLSKERSSLEAPDGAAALTLQRDGNLVLRARGADGALDVLWSTGTTDTNGRAATRALSVASKNGHPVLEVSSTVGGERDVTWHSDLLSSCASAPRLRNDTMPVPERLEISGAGKLTLTDVCDIHVPTSERMSRALAVVVSGVAAGGNVSCVMPLIADASFSSVDVFARVLAEEDGKEEEVEGELRACYGDALRSTTVLRAEAPASSSSTDETPGACAGELEGWDVRLKNLRDAGKTWWEWGAEKGILHDTILAVSADAKIGDGEPPRFRALEETGQKVVDVGVGRGLYCPRMTGAITPGTFHNFPGPFHLFSTLLYQTFIWSKLGHRLTTYSPLRPHNIRLPLRNVPLPKPPLLPPRTHLPRGIRRRRAKGLFRVRSPPVRPAGRGLPSPGALRGGVPCCVAA